MVTIDTFDGSELRLTSWGKGSLSHLQGFIHPRWMFGISEPSTVVDYFLLFFSSDSEVWLLVDLSSLIIGLGEICRNLVGEIITIKKPARRGEVSWLLDCRYLDFCKSLKNTSKARTCNYTWTKPYHFPRTPFYIPNINPSPKSIFIPTQISPK